MDLDELISRLDLPTKIRLLTGADMWSLPPLPEIGLDRLVMSDGPIGVRGEQWSAADPSIALPSPTALAATWDVELVRRAGALLAQEARRKGVHVLLAPTLNLHRSPLGGRHFECFSEDAYLTGEIGAAYVEGVQEGGVATTPKHFVANDFETDRFTVDVVAGEQALRELYLRPFERVVRAGAWGMMTAYNSVNGTTMTEHAELVHGVLKDEWGFDGFVVSDWTAVRSTEAAALGGTDVAMPGPRGPWGPRLEAAVREGRVPESAVDDRVRRILRLAQRVGALHPAGAGSRAGAGSTAGADEANGPAGATGTPGAAGPEVVDGVALAREIAARAFTLLTNDGVLPLQGAPALALIGVAAREARVMGGGSAQVFPDRIVSPLQGLSGRTEVRYALGTDPRIRLSPLPGPVTAQFLDGSGAVLSEQPLATGEARWLGQLPPGVDATRLRTVRLRAAYTARESGEHELSVAGVGAFTLTVNGEAVLDESIGLDAGDPAVAFLSPPEKRVGVPMTAGETYELTLAHPPGLFGGMAIVSFTLGHAEPTPGDDELMAEAVRVARACDVAVVVAGTTPEVESEGFDRPDLRLPGRQDELISAVAAANPRTVVVVNAGSPVEMPWLAEVAAVLLTWFPGQEAGEALADVLFGDAEPGGRLPTTWPERLADAPVAAVTPVDGKVFYDEGVFTGYPAWRRAERPPAFWFGHGLGYTTWSYDSIAAEGTSVSVAVTNTGTRPGREVVQVYAGPRRRLAAFDVVEAEPGQTVVTTLFLPERAFQVWEDGWRTVSGEQTVEAGRSSADLRLSATVKI
ncbi:beta-glucosidase [Nonomuraea thailandensis]|uniref:Beta-glucosidase n=1 Tax=Nonomuraea thailandensis TaxID=1188745 RepID=A0A9X2K4S9_9ACTN|nr:glycoside hydrolase family 3 C-terminal domain-containing protein [Nonomuraea thailandensis]MCP2359680.1 beta-glucosidase [Nonomuraea thailandensis]